MIWEYKEWSGTIVEVCSFPFEYNFLSCNFCLNRFLTEKKQCFHEEANFSIFKIPSCDSLKNTKKEIFVNFSKKLKEKQYLICQILSWKNEANKLWFLKVFQWRVFLFCIHCYIWQIIANENLQILNKCQRPISLCWNTVFFHRELIMDRFFTSFMKINAKIEC